MTPLGAKFRALREARGISLKEMAAALNVSSAYLSALEHGRRGQPTSFLLHRIIAFFNVIWDEAEELQRLAEISDPKVTIDTGGLAPKPPNSPIACATISSVSSPKTSNFCEMNW